MLSFLPEQKQKEIKRMYRMRLGIVISIVVIGVCGVAFALLLPSYYLIQRAAVSSGESVANLTAIIEQSSVANAQTVISSFSRELKFLESVPDEQYASERIADIIAIQPSNITLNKILLLRDGSSTLHLAGTARNREELVAYRAILESLSWAGRVDLPIENLAQGRNIPFSLTVRGEF